MSPTSSADLAGADIFAAPLHRKDQQVAAFRHHAGKDLATDHGGARRNDHFREAGRAIEQRVGHTGLGLAGTEGQMLVTREARCRIGFAAQEQRVAFFNRRARQWAPRGSGLRADQAQPG